LGGRRGRWLVFDGSDQLRSDFEWTFLEHAGMKTPGEAEELQALVREEMNMLDEIRGRYLG
jgi:hypothetical protein